MQVNPDWLGIDLSSNTLNASPEDPSLVGKVEITATARPDGLGEAENLEFKMHILVLPGGGPNAAPGP